MAVVNVRMKQRRKTAALWTSTNEVLLDGEIGLETDTRKTKFGDGVTAWASLAYAAPAIGPNLSAIEALTPANDDFLQRKAGAWTNRTVAQVKTDLGLGTAPMTASVAAFALTGGTAHDLCFIDLPVGTWAVSGNVSFVPSGGTTPTILRAYITTVSATQPATPNAGAIQQISSTGFPADNGQSLVAGRAVFTVASGTTRVYLGTRTAFTGPTMAAEGHLLAIRVT